MTRISFEVKSAKQTRFPAFQIDNDPNNWSVKIYGPGQSIYQTGIYTISLKFPEVYPFVPPELSFVTKIWHPNVCPSTGKIDFGVLFSQWLVSISIEDILVAIERLLAVPRCSDCPCHVQFTQYNSREFVGFQFHKNPKKFKRTAVHWTHKYANPRCFRGMGNTVAEFRNDLLEISEHQIRANESVRVGQV